MRRLSLTGWFGAVVAPVSAVQQEPNPIIVDIGKAESELTGLADVLIGSLGLAGLLILAAIVAAAVFAGVLFWLRMKYGKSRTETSTQLKIG
jgi:hypothetical protein